MQILCFSPFGYEGNLVNVEVDLRRGIPAVDMVGLADNAVKESRERMKSAIINSGLLFPPERVLISLSPADLKKEGAGFDLAVALAVLNAKEKLDEQNDDEKISAVFVMGELELNGNVRPIKAIHAAVSTAYASGIRYCIVPKGNDDEAREIRGMKIFGAENLTEAFHALKNPENFTTFYETSSADEIRENLREADEVNGIYFSAATIETEFAEVKGQSELLRALQIAAGGGHNLLAFGPPGCGKTLSMQKFPSLLPLLTKEESQSVTRIFSIAGILKNEKRGIQPPPFRQPHQTATIEGLCGGGVHCQPGEISLAHNGVLFLDEAAEFRPSVLQMLRVPMESAKITLSRAGRSTVFPANFQLLMSTNPCPCGNFGSKEKICLCSSRAIEQYWKKFSAPLLDRIELRVRVESSKNSAEIPDEKKSTAMLRQQIASAVKIQRKRGKKNARLSPAEVKEFCVMTNEAKNFLEDSAEKGNFSQRAISGCIKVARTIADMAEKEKIGEEEMREAVKFRFPKGAEEFLP
jgi:magnesium chelatase family protein